MNLDNLSFDLVSQDEILKSNEDNFSFDLVSQDEILKSSGPI